MNRERPACGDHLGIRVEEIAPGETLAPTKNCSR
jgi:hypothetical protein